MNFIQLVDAIRIGNLRHQLRFAEHRRGSNNPQFMEEFGTVSIDFGRQTGKTTYIIKRATPLDLVITRNRYTADHFTDHRPDMIHNVIYNLNIDKFRGKYAAFQNVYVDDAKFTSRNQAELIFMFPTIQQIIKFGYCD